MLDQVGNDRIARPVIDACCEATMNGCTRRDKYVDCFHVILHDRYFQGSHASAACLLQINATCHVFLQKPMIDASGVQTRGQCGIHETKTTRNTNLMTVSVPSFPTQVLDLVDQDARPVLVIDAALSYSHIPQAK